MGPRLRRRGLDPLQTMNTIYADGWVFTPNGTFKKASVLAQDTLIRGIIEPGDAPPGDGLDGVRRIDLTGQYVLPGFTDSHIHLTALALNRLRCDLSSSTSARDLCERLARWAQAHPDAPMVVGVDFDESSWENAQLPTRVMLDGIDDRRWVLARRICGHIGVVNTPLLERLRKRPDFVDEATGVVREHTLWEAGRMWTPDAGDVRRSYQAAIEGLHRLGVTTIHDIVEPDGFEMYIDGVSKSAVSLRIDALVHTNPRDLEYYRRMCAESGARDFRVVGVK
jgi:predicted amidohydrolase YtcJ